MKIVADENIPHLKAFFSRFGEITALPGRQISATHLKNADILLVRSVTPVNAQLLAGSNVKFVGTCTIGVDHLDTDYLQTNHIAYASAPGCNADGVVQYVLSALASLESASFGKKIGVIGSGNVGGRLCKTLDALGVNVCAYDPFLTPAQNPVLTDIGTVLACDVICMHAPLTNSGPHPTLHMINQQNLPLIKPKAILLNAGRGGTIDNQALKLHLQQGADLRVILDVWEGEPNIDLDLLDLVAFATPHIAGYSYEGRVNGSAMIFAAMAKAQGMSASEIKAETQRVLRDVNGEPSTLFCHSVTEAVLASYSIRDDDLRMRTTLKKAKNIGVGFDILRKNYPQRREFGHFKIETKNAELKRTLVDVGFMP